MFRCKVLPIEFFFFFAQLLGVLRFMVLAGLKGREEASIYIYIYMYMYMYIYICIYIYGFLSSRRNGGSRRKAYKVIKVMLGTA